MEAIISWSKEMSLGVPAMDAAHKEFLDELTRLAEAQGDQFTTGFCALVAALEKDFRDEEELMETIEFPALRSHREQHARVLSGLHHVAPYVMKGDIAQGKDAITLLPQWFLFHLATMDLALAVALDLTNASKCRSLPDSENEVAQAPPDNMS